MTHFINLRSLSNTWILIIISALFISTNLNAQDPEPILMDYFPDIKILESNSPAPGYYFLASKNVYADIKHQYLAIVDNYGTPVFFRLLDGNKSTIRMLEDGRIVYWNGSPRILTFLDEMLQVADTITTRFYSSDGHDWDVSEEGNILLFGHDDHIEDLSQIVEGGQTEVNVQDIIVQEFDKNKNLLYTWKSRDHFNVLDALGESDLAKYTSNELDYIHANSVHFDSDTSFILSSRHMNEITKIDRRTQEIIWRLGGKNNDFTFIGDGLIFSHQHSISRTPSGTILLFSNGNTHPEPRFSSTEEYLLDEINMTATLVKRFRRIPDIYQKSAGSVQRVYNGNTLTGWNIGGISMTEFHPDGSVAAEYDFTHHSNSNEIEKFLWETKIFETDIDTLDFGKFDGSNAVKRTIEITNNTDKEIAITSYSTHTDIFQLTTRLPIAIPSHGTSQVEIVFDPSASDLGYFKDLVTLNHDIDTQRVARQVWLFGTQNDDISPIAQITPSGNNIAIDTAIIINLSEPISRFLSKELTYNTIDNYILFRSDDINGVNLGFDAIIDTEKMNIKIIPSEPLQADHRYYIAILEDLYDYSNNALPMTETTFYTGNNVGVDDPKSENKIALYPNPTNGKFSISTGNNYELKYIFIYSLTGKLIDNIQSEENIIDVDINSQIPGQYMVVIKNHQQQILKTFKLIKY